MSGIQSRGRTRNNTNKIERVKTQNKIISTQPRSTRYQPRPSSGKLDQSTQNKIQSTDSNIAQAVTVEKAKKMGSIINESTHKNFIYWRKTNQNINTSGKDWIGSSKSGNRL